MFLADRYIKGTCPRCHSPDQYGDNCEHCGATYDALVLINPVSVYSGATPIAKTSEHLFFNLPDFFDLLSRWIHSGTLQEAMANKLQEWLDAGLQPWGISRDAPYFGFTIPDEPNKYFYVWLDAPIGYLSSFKKLCAQRDDLDFDAYWQASSTTELYHNIGKDIINFHALFWPALLHCAGLRKPSGIWAHGYVTVNGEKMSKSRGTFITAEAYLRQLQPEYLRYYYASKLSSGINDIDLNLQDLLQKANTDLVGKLINIASRCAGFIQQQGGHLAAQLHQPSLFEHFAQASEGLAQLYEAREFSQAMRKIMLLADQANEYIQTQAPWALNKQAGQAEQVRRVCTTALNLFRQLIIYLTPVLPEIALKAQQFLHQPQLCWQDSQTPLLDHTIAPFTPMLTRIDPRSIEQLIQPQQDPAAPAAAPQPDCPPTPAMIQFDDFAKLDLRVAQVIAAEAVEGADKLLRLTLDLGDHTKQVLSGIKPAYTVAQVVGKRVLYLYNLAPRKMRFGVSEGMVLAGGQGSQIRLIEPDAALPLGTCIS